MAAYRIGTLAALVCLGAAPAHAQGVADFYKGKQIQMIIATNAGVGYDIYARLLIAHMGKHVPGNPGFVPRNMVGAGGLRTADYVYRVAPKDGLTMGTIGRGLPFEPMLGQNELNIDPLKFAWLGSMNRETAVAFSWHTSKIKTFADLRANELLTPGTGAGADSEIMPLAFNNLTGTKFKIIKGYKGTSEGALAMERGELDGIAYWSLGSLTSLHRHWLDDRRINVLFHTGRSAHPDLPGAPSIRDLTTSGPDRLALDFILAREALGRPFFSSPDLPADRAAALRSAFEGAMKDPELISEAKKRRIEINLVTGAEVADLLQRASTASPDTIAKVKAALDR